MLASARTRCWAAALVCRCTLHQASFNRVFAPEERPSGRTGHIRQRSNRMISARN